jgi:general secretion pathway protein B
MSYILDALKRAEAERERGAVPGLHARPVVSYNEVGDDASPKGWWLVAAAALVLVAGVAGFWWWRAPTPLAPVREPTPVAKAAVPEAPLPAAPVLMTPLPATQSLARAAPAAVVSKASPQGKALTPSAPVATLQPVPRPITAQPAKAPVISTKSVPAPLPVTKPAPITATQPPVTATASAARLAPAAPGSGIPMLSELPEALRKQIPPLTIAGAVYSDDPSQRLLLVNNQAFGQGNAVAPGVQLEEIQTNSSVFNFQGTRFQVDH